MVYKNEPCIHVIYSAVVSNSTVKDKQSTDAFDEFDEAIMVVQRENLSVTARTKECRKRESMPERALVVR